jgi:hypothetical protein
LTIANFYTDASPFWVGDGSTVTCKRCKLFNNTVVLKYANSAVVSANAVDSTASYSQHQNTILRLEQCTVVENSAEVTFVEYHGNPFYYYNALIYSDVAVDVLRVDASEALETSKPLTDAPADRPGIENASPWKSLNTEVRSSTHHAMHLRT